jgi:hypothetical protein
VRECIQFMNATKAFRAAQMKAPGQAVSQLVSVGEELTPEVVRSCAIAESGTWQVPLLALTGDQPRAPT